MTTWRQEARAAGWSAPRAKPAPRVVETPEYVQMVRRMLARLGERAGDDPTALPALAEMRDVITLALVAAVSAARAQSEPYSWAEIGRELGVSRQAAQQWHERQLAGAGEPE